MHCSSRWTNTEQYTGAFKVMNKTMQHYYTKVNEVTRIKTMPSILACACEVRGAHFPSFSQAHHPALRAMRNAEQVRSSAGPAGGGVAQYSEIPIQPSDQEDLQKMLNAPVSAMFPLRKISRWFGGRCRRLTPRVVVGAGVRVHRSSPSSRSGSSPSRSSHPGPPPRGAKGRRPPTKRGWSM
jgi:hypothetical protein